MQDIKARTWYNTRFREYQLSCYHKPRTDWYNWIDLNFKPAPILDLGCGKFKLDGTIGIDVSKFSSTDVLADVENLPIQSQSVGTVLSSHLLEHVHPFKMIAEVSRILKPRGVFLLEAPNLIGLPRALHVYRSGIRDSRYPLGSRSILEAFWKGISSYRLLGLIPLRMPDFNVGFPGKDPDALWFCNSLATVNMLKGAGFSIRRTFSLFGKTFRIEAIKKDA